MQYNNHINSIQNFEPYISINYEKTLLKKIKPMKKFTTENNFKNNVIKHLFENGYIVEVHLKINTAYKILGEKIDKFSIENLTVFEFYKILNKIADEPNNF